MKEAILGAAAGKKRSPNRLIVDDATNDDNSVIAGWCEHALRPSLGLGTTPIVDGHT